MRSYCLRTGNFGNNGNRVETARVRLTRRVEHWEQAAQCLLRDRSRSQFLRGNLRVTTNRGAIPALETTPGYPSIGNSIIRPRIARRISDELSNLLVERGRGVWFLKETGDQTPADSSFTATKTRTLSSCRHRNRLESEMWATCSPKAGNSGRKSSYPALISSRRTWACV